MIEHKNIKQRHANDKKKALSSSESSSSTAKAIRWILRLTLAALAGVQFYKGRGNNNYALAFHSKNENENNDEDHNTQQQQKEARIRRYQTVYKYQPPAEKEPRNVTNNNVNPICGPPPDFTAYFSQPQVGRDLHRSANNEDRTIYDLFGEQFRALGSQGHYLELGAFDGLTESNTRFFDECLGWNGVLIEGNPTKYDALVKNRPRAHRLSFAPSCSLEEELQNTTIPFHAVPWTNGGLAGFANDYRAGFQIVNVTCGRLSPVIEDIMSSRIHFFSLDVEGSEPLILKHIDFARVKIDLIMVESWNGQCKQEPAECKTRSEARAILKAAGYLRYSNVIVKSDLYIHPQSEFQLPNERISG